MWILAYLCSSLDPRLGGHFSPIWSPSKSLLKYDTFSLWNLQFLAPEAPRVISLNLGCPNPCPDIASRLPSEPPGLNLSLQASIAATRPQSEPPGLNLRLQASIWAWRLQSQPPGFNLSLDASISAHSSQSEHFPPCGPPPNPYWNMTHSLYDICLYWTKASRPIFPNLGSLQIRIKIFADWFRFLIQLV